MRSLQITRPDDFHVHLRDLDFLNDTVNASAKHFARALVMPNLQPALTTIDMVLAYRQRIIDHCEYNTLFAPYMTLYLNESVRKEELAAIKNHSYILGAKLYPQGATTNSGDGAKSIKALYPLFEVMQEFDLVLQIHGEVTHGDIFEREALFINEELKPLIENFPNLRVVLEHISTKEAVDFIYDSSKLVAATITPHHLLFNRNHMLAQGIRPHYYCLPILKDEANQKALLKAATSGNFKFFGGTDSAPHAQNTKESSCGCAGVYSAPFAVAMYAEAFDSMGKLHALDDFLGKFGAMFYNLPINADKIELIERAQTIPKSMSFGNSLVIPAAAGDNLKWSVNESI